MNYVKEAFSKYATFEGRSRRKEYWFFWLFSCVILFVLTFIDVAFGTYSDVGDVGLLSGLFMLAILIPAIAVTVRRLHDTDRSGWWILLNLIPVIGGLVVLVFTLLDSQPGANRFGPNPKGVAGTTAAAAAV